MGLLRPATPGFIVTLVATVLLAVVSFCVPYFKSIFFLKASITVDNFNGNITFGTLGYCLELSNGTTCSKPSIGYEIDINGLVGNKLPVQIPVVVVKWLTYALFLHVIALIGAAGSAVFGLLAHVREMSMACCSTCISGFAAVIAMLAFVFDLVLFFVAKSRINAVGSAQIGNAIWLTLAAWLLLFFSGCFYTLGRCCISNRPSGGKKDRWNPPNGRNADPEVGGPKTNYAEQMRLDAVKAEADRKARAKKAEGGLPAFGENETYPLTAHVDGDRVYLEGEHEHDNGSQDHLTSSAAPPARQQGYAGGYAPATPGNRAMDDYYGQAHTSGSNTYPPQQQQNLGRQRSEYAPSTYTANVPHSPSPQHSLPAGAAGYGASAAAAGYAAYNAPMTTSPPPNQMLAPPGQYNNSDPYGREYGHTAGGSSYHTAISHGQQPSAYSQYDPYRSQSPPLPQPQQQRYAEPTFSPETYNNTAVRLNSPPPMPNASTPNPYFAASSASTPHQQSYPERGYTLGGDGYGANTLPPLPEHESTPTPPGGYYGGYGGDSSSRGQGYSGNPYGGYEHEQAAPINTNLGYAGGQPTSSPVRGPRVQPALSLVGPHPEDSPPGYEPSNAGVQGNWGKR